jgi:cellulose synthase/poly-beta-1,6-N-acetylglucosamine synthase-like glycosyltransferase
MKYDIFWIIGVFLVIALWAVVLTCIFGYIVFPRNILVNSDIDLFIPTLAAMSFNLTYLFLGAFIFITYLFKINRLKKHNHHMIKHKRGHFNNDICSIIIPARDEETVIRGSVLKCLRQTYRNIEVLVIVHNSSDGTFEESKVGDGRVRSFDLKTKASGKAIALNYGIKQSRGKYIMIIDADTILEDNFIENAMPALSDESLAAVQGRVFPLNRGYNFLTKLMAMEDDLWQEPIMTTRSVLGERCPLLGTGFIVRKKVLIEEGMFSNSLVDDHVLTCKLLRRKYRIIYLPLCRAYAEEPASLQVMLRQRARWGRGFINCLHHKMADSSDIVGNLLWFMPLGTFANSIMFIIVVYATIFNLIFEYLPYSFAYLPLQLWFIVAGIMMCLYVSVLLKVHGVKEGIRRAMYLVPFIAFSQYGMVICYKALFVRTWGTTKTIHGFTQAVMQAPSIERARREGAFNG